MIIVADENIPKVAEWFGRLGSVRTFEGRRIEPDMLREASVLLVRSVTRVDAGLLDDTPVRFVGSATIGMDHVDTAYLRSRGVHFSFAPGSNATSVAEYVIAAILALTSEAGEALEGKTMGLVGFGNTGSRVAPRVRALGMHVVASDPPLEVEGKLPSGLDVTPLDELVERSDVVSLHVPLTEQDPFPTRQLLDEARLERLRRGALLINTSRGAVLSTDHLLAALASRPDVKVVLDVWENEPHPDPRLLVRASLATPHVAGYSYDGKVRATAMLYDALLQFLGRGGEPPQPVPAEGIPIAPSEHPDPVFWADRLVQRMYDIRADDRRMRRLLGMESRAIGDEFTRLRRDYPVRREFWNYVLPRTRLTSRLADLAVHVLGVRVE